MKEKKEQVIGPVQCVVSKISTKTDGSFDVTINLPPIEASEVGQNLLELALFPTLVYLTLVKAKR